MWRWEGEAFGNTAPNEDVDGDGQPTVISLRFPGQYADAETGFYYNYFRYYRASTGRYITSDRLGMDGGFNTYLYADASPIRRVDPRGLVAWTGEFDIKAFSIWVGGAAASFELTSDCVDGVKAKISIDAKAVVAVDIGVLPPSQTKGSITLEDHKLHLDPYAFSGPFEFVTVGPVIGPLDFFTRVRLGDAFSRSINARGLDLSVFSGATGNAGLAGPVQYIQCGCKVE